MNGRNWDLIISKARIQLLQGNMRLPIRKSAPEIDVRAVVRPIAKDVASSIDFPEKFILGDSRSVIQWHEN